MDNKVIGIIPARYHSKRFEGKPLALIMGKTLIQRTFENAKKCSHLDDLFIATDDDRIADHAQSFGAKVIMTSSNCQSGTERLVEALRNNADLQKADIIVNIQGDHPCISSGVIEKIIEKIANDPKASMSTAISPLTCMKTASSKHIVKCVFDRFDNALYFSRATIPHGADSVFFHVGIYAYRKDFLYDYPNMQETRLDKYEDLEQLKVLENGYRIKVARVQEEVINVDVFEDIAKVEAYLCL